MSWQLDINSCQYLLTPKKKKKKKDKLMSILISADANSCSRKY